MTRFSTNTMAAFAAIILTLSSIGAITNVPSASVHPAPIATVPVELA